MKVIHCPATENPLDYARRVAGKRGGGGLGELLRGNMVVVVLLVVVVVGTFTVGPLKPQPQSNNEAAPQATATALPVAAYVEPVLCKLPAGGQIQVGWTAHLVEDEELFTVRCMEDGTLQKVTQ